MGSKLFYKIGEACRELDIQPYVLRYWETEFPFLKPDKMSSGQRVYTPRELQIIRRIKELLYDEGYTIAGAKKKLEAEIQQGGPRLLELVPSQPRGGDGGKEGEEASARVEAAAVAVVEDEAPGAAADASPGDAAPIAQAQLHLDALPDRLDSSAAEQVQTLVRGLRELRDEVQEILEILRRNP
jgi:DNA-binding transcriptional MerR regulator